MILFVAAIGNSYGQQCGIALTKTMADTIKYASPPQTFYIISYYFKNNSGIGFDTSHRLRLRRFHNATPLTLNWRTVGTFAPDSTLVYRDTLGFTAAPSTNPANLCDSVWLTTGAGTVIPDTFVANNKTCKSVRFVADPASVRELAVDASSIELYPNPVSDKLNLRYDFHSKTNADVIIRDLTGRTVIEKNLGNNLYGTNVFQLETGKLAVGMYILELNTDGGKAISKFQVSK